MIAPFVELVLACAPTSPRAALDLQESTLHALPERPARVTPDPRISSRNSGFSESRLEESLGSQGNALTIKAFALTHARNTAP